MRCRVVSSAHRSNGICCIHSSSVFFSGKLNKASQWPAQTHVLCSIIWCFYYRKYKSSAETENIIMYSSGSHLFIYFWFFLLLSCFDSVKIGIFYAIFYAALATLVALCMWVFFQTLDPRIPKRRLEDSLIGTSPGKSLCILIKYL